MKRLNNYFFGGTTHWTDYVWFYGTILFGIGMVVYTLAKIH